MRSISRQFLRFYYFCALAIAYPSYVFARDPELQRGIQAAEGIRVGGTSDIRTTTQTILNSVLNYLGIAAVVVLVIGGFMLVVGLGSDESKKRAKNIIIYSIVGLIVIALAKAFVLFVGRAGTGTI